MTLQWHFLPDFRQKDKEFKVKQKSNYDRKHRTKPADTLPDNSSVWVTTGNNQTPRTVVSNAGTPRSYIVNTPSGPVHRNKQHLNHRLNRINDNFDIPNDPPSTPRDHAETERGRIMTRTQTGTDIRSPNRLRYDWAQEGDVT